jgi:hypothetical protein
VLPVYLLPSSALALSAPNSLSDIVSGRGPASGPSCGRAYDRISSRSVGVVRGASPPWGAASSAMMTSSNGKADSKASNSRNDP